MRLGAPSKSSIPQGLADSGNLSSAEADPAVADDPAFD
jgi:hypothetical protein